MCLFEDLFFTKRGWASIGIWASITDFTLGCVSSLVQVHRDKPDECPGGGVYQPRQRQAATGPGRQGQGRLLLQALHTTDVRSLNSLSLLFFNEYIGGQMLLFPYFFL